VADGDVKPSNLMDVRPAAEVFAKVADFGLATAEHAETR
jgi:hypothetical protein